jgi:hypothetical protein
LLTRRRSLRRRVGLRRPDEVAARPDDSGFTLVELLLVICIVPVMIIAIAAGLVTVFSIQGSVSHRLSDSGDAQIVSAHYISDVQGSLELTTDATATQCGTGTQLLGLESNQNATTGVWETVVSYSEVNHGKTNWLQRDYCTHGASGSPTSTETVSFDIAANEAPPTVTGSAPDTAALASDEWISTSTITNVDFTITEPQSGYTYSLSAIPATSAAPSTGGSPIVASTNTSCGFAATENGTVSNGTYAQTLCFVDFSSYNVAANAAEAAAPSCLEMVASIPGGFTLSFCMSESGNQPMVATTLPTYPEAFLGNTLTNQDNESEPFYTGLGCSSSTPAETGTGAPTPSCISPAMYQTDSGYGPTNTLTFTNISVTTATGAPATGWEFVSADAETTDSNEEITWTSNQDLYILANSPGSSYGNTCNNEPDYWNGPQGAGTTQIVCQAGLEETSAIKTGTPMVEAATPTTMTVAMKGAGLEGIAVGLLLS